MNRNIILERPVVVRCWRVVGQVAKAEKRPELTPVLLRASETGGTDARDLAGHLFFETRSRRVVAERLLRIGVVYGLLEERNGKFTLTTAGETAIDTGDVLVPQFGAWTIWASEEPLLHSPILCVDAWKEPLAFDEIKGRKRESAKQRSSEELPRWIRNVVGTPITLAAGSGAEIRIDDLEDKAEAVDANGLLRLSWNVGDGRLQLTGTLTLEGKKVTTELDAPSMSPNRVWRALLENGGLLEQWDEERQVLYVSVDETNETEREAMSRILEFESPDVPDYGKFEPLAVSEVPITAPSEVDAQSWAKWRLRARIRDYATSERYGAWRNEAAAPFKQYEIELPTRTELFDEVCNRTPDRRDPRFWRLAAAEDWRL